MGASQYASSFGRLQSIAINFLSEEFLLNLLKAKLKKYKKEIKYLFW